MQESYTPNPHTAYPIPGDHYPRALAAEQELLRTAKPGELEIKMGEKYVVDGFNLDDPEDFAFFVAELSNRRAHSMD